MRRILHLAVMSFISGFSGAVMPGPMLALVVGQTFTQGFVAVPIICAGHALLELVIVLLLIAGLRSVLQKPTVRAGIGFLGGAALIYFGLSMVGSASSVALDLRTTNHSGLPWLQLMVVGAVVCLANPYFTAWWATVGSGQMAFAAPRSFGEYLAFYAGHEMSDLSWYSLVGILIVSGRQSFSPAVYHGLVLTCGGVIVALGMLFLVGGVSTVTGSRRRNTESTGA